MSAITDHCEDKDSEIDEGFEIIEEPMPESFKMLLEGLPSTDAKKLWDWLDATPDCVDDIISAIVDKHHIRTEDPNSTKRKFWRQKGTQTW